jgi:hypothetical protein
VLAQTSTSKQDAALFAEMLKLPNDGRYPKLDLAPELLPSGKEKTHPEITPPNSCQVHPSNFCNCICLMGA